MICYIFLTETRSTIESEINKIDNLLHNSSIRLCWLLEEWFSRNHFLNFSCVCLPLEKLVNKKHFPVKEKFGLVSMKVFFWKFRLKTLFGSCEKFRNVILFTDYINFDPQTFDCYIYFVLNIYFSISYLKILFLY